MARHRLPARRTVRHDRHGRAGRSSVFGPDLFSVGRRSDEFVAVVRGATEYLRSVWSDELTGVTFAVGSVPPRDDEGTVRRWAIDRAEQRITLYRVPIERLSRLHVNDAEHRRVLIESTVFRATAEYVGMDPWGIDDGPRRP